MNILFYIDRTTGYFRKHGLRNTICQVFKKLPGIIFPGLNNLYYVELSELPENFNSASMDFEVVCRREEAGLTETERQVIQNHIGRQCYEEQMNERLVRGASLFWLAKQGEQVLGFMWTVVQNTINHSTGR